MTSHNFLDEFRMVPYNTPLNDSTGWLLKLCRVFFQIFCCQIVVRSLPDRADTRARFFFQISRFSKKSGTGVQTPTPMPDSGNNFQIFRLCQILAKGLSVPEYVCMHILFPCHSPNQAIKPSNNCHAPLHNGRQGMQEWQ